MPILPTLTNENEFITFFLNNMLSRKDVLADLREGNCTEEDIGEIASLGYRERVHYATGQTFISKGGNYYSTRLATYISLIRENELAMKTNPESIIGRRAEYFLRHHTPF